MNQSPWAGENAYGDVLRLYALVDNRALMSGIRLITEPAPAKRAARKLQ